MIYSTDRILTTHAGSLPRPDDVREMVLAKSRGEAVDQAALDKRLTTSVAEIVKRQIECGLDIVNDGELSKPNFTDYVLARIAGYEKRPGSGRRRLDMTARDERKFAGYFAAHPRSALYRRPDPAGLRRRTALCRAGRPPARPRQFQSRARRGECRGRLSAGQHAGHDRALDGQ